MSVPFSLDVVFVGDGAVVVADGYAQCFAQGASICGECFGGVWAMGFQCFFGCGDALADEVFVLGDCAVGQAIEEGEHVFCVLRLQKGVR